MSDIDKYAFTKNQCPDTLDTLDTEQSSCLLLIIQHSVHHFLPSENVCVLKTIVHLDEGAKGAKFRINTIVKTDMSVHMITSFGSLKYVSLKLRDITERKKPPETVWMYDRCISIRSERGAYDNIDAQIRTSEAAGHSPRYASFASAQLSHALVTAEAVTHTESVYDFSSPLPIISSQPVQALPVVVGWAGDW